MNNTNMTRIDNMTPAVFEAFMEAKMNPEEDQVLSHLNKKEKYQFAVAMGWDLNDPNTTYWIELD